MSHLLRISKACEYAINAMSVIAVMEFGQALRAEEIANQTGSPPKFIASILTQLSKSGLIEGVRTSHRGYRLARPAEQISVLDIIEAVDGDFEKPGCFMDSDRKCVEKSPCALHATWRSIRDSVRATLSATLLTDMVAKDRERNSTDTPTGATHAQISRTIRFR